MPYVLSDNIYGYISQTTGFISGDNVDLVVVLYKDSLNNQLDVINYDQVKVEVFDHFKRKKATFAKVPGAGEMPLTIGQKTQGEEGHIQFRLDAATTATFETGDVFVKVTIIQSSYTVTPIANTLPYLKIADKLPEGSTSGGSSSMPSTYKATVPAVTYEITSTNSSLPNPGEGDLTLNSSNPSNVTAIKLHNTEASGKLNVYLSQMVGVLNSGANLLITLTNFNNPSDYVMYRVVSGNPVDLDNDGASLTDRDDVTLMGVQFMAAASSSNSIMTFTEGSVYGLLFDSYSGAGLQGPTGAQGAQGSAGATGATGAQGAAG
jgi:hypothetical protein